MHLSKVQGAGVKNGSTTRLDHGNYRLARVLTSVLLGLVLLGFAALMAGDLVASRKREIETVKRDSDNLAQVIERQITTAVEKIDLVLRETAIDFTPYVIGRKKQNLLTANLELKRRMEYTPEVQKDSLRILNKEGRVIFNAGTTTELPKVYVGDRAYFQQQKNSHRDSLVISEPLLSRFTGKWLITLSRPIFDERGEFAGVVQMALRTEYFQSIFERIDIDAHGNISLFDADWRLLSRNPVLPERLGKTFNSPARDALAAGELSASYEAVSVVDGVNRLFVARKLGNMPYVVVIGRATEEFLYSWYVKAKIYAIGFLALAVALGSFLYIFYRQTEYSHRLASQVFAAASEAILITDDKGCIITANEAFTQITGYQLDEVKGQTIDLLRSERHPDSFFADMQQQIAEFGQWRGEIWYRLKNGEHHPHLMSVATLRDGAGHMTNCVAMFSDIAALNAARQQAELANRAKGAFLATMSHEIRTPLNGILGMAQMLLLQNLKPREIQDFARTILNSGNVLLTLLNDILDLSKIEAGKLEIKAVAFEPQQLLLETASLFQELAREKGLSLEAEWQGDPVACYEADATRLRQMLANLTNNAIKFTASGSVRIVGKALADPYAGVMLEFSVLDSGIGIPAEQIPLLFKPFTQVDSSDTRQYGGTGLGLSIVRNLAELMGGEAGCESTPEAGSHFWFKVKAALLVGQRERRSQARPLSLGKATDMRARILLVEDSQINQRVIAAMLEKLGYEVECASNGEEGLAAAFSGRRIDLIVMDCQMPVMDGFTATENIRSRELSLGVPRVPIVALTAAAYESDRERCLSVGMNEFMTKPVNMNDLAETLERQLHKPDKA